MCNRVRVEKCISQNLPIFKSNAIHNEAKILLGQFLQSCRNYLGVEKESKHRKQVSQKCDTKNVK
jgi:hypothetical protein